jgi:hypothetical protein
MDNIVTLMPSHGQHTPSGYQSVLLISWTINEQRCTAHMCSYVGVHVRVHVCVCVLVGGRGQWRAIGIIEVYPHRTGYPQLKFMYSHCTIPCNCNVVSVVSLQAALKAGCWFKWTVRSSSRRKV